MIKRGEACQLAPSQASGQQIATELISCDFEKNFCNWIDGTDPNIPNTTQYKWRSTVGLSSFDLDSGPKDGGANSTSYYITAQQEQINTG